MTRAESRERRLVPLCVTLAPPMFPASAHTPNGFNLAAALLGAGAPEAPALLEPERAWSYAHLSEVSRRFGAALVQLGVRRGDRVAVLMPDGMEAAASILGAIYVGAIAVPMTELGRAFDLRAMMRDAGAAVAVVHRSLEPILDEVRRELPTLREVVTVGGAQGGEHDFDALIAAARPHPAPAPGDNSPAFILYSAGGESREPRGVVISHRTPPAAFELYARNILKITAQDRVFSVAKHASAYGLGAGLVFPLAAGASAILLPGQPHSREVVNVVNKHAPTLMFASPSLYAQLLTDLGQTSGLLTNMRACISGAEMLPATLAERLHLGLGVEVLPGYGLTEACHFVLATRQGNSRPGSCGQVLPDCEARVVDDDGAELPPHEIGCLEVRSPAMASGYWNRSEDTAHTFRGPWVRTADRFMQDPDGFFFHCGRSDGYFKVSGRWVSPSEVERSLLRHEAVWECAVVGIDDDQGLTKPLAFVVPNVGHSPSPMLERELIEWVKEELAPYKYPRWIEFIDSLPRGPGGKVLRYKLAASRRRRPVTLAPPAP
jgi:benzoate-CoA ligase